MHNICTYKRIYVYTNVISLSTARGHPIAINGNCMHARASAIAQLVTHATPPTRAHCRAIESFKDKNQQRL